VHAASLFAARAAARTFEASYFWWYLLRPFEAALVAMVLVAVARAGIPALGPTGTDGGHAGLAFVAGGLAGLFTDQVMQQLRGLLGATKIDHKASTLTPPGKFANTGPAPANGPAPHATEVP
jgi:hypothetical protein